MGLSVASLSPIRTAAYVQARPLAYSIDNESAVSSAYRESIGNTSTPEGVQAPSPVRYANANYQVSSVESNLVANQRANKAYNDIASNFAGINTSYDRGASASSYAAYGQFVDAFV